MAFKITKKEALLLNLPGRISREYVSGINGSKNVALRLVEIQPLVGEATRSMHFHPDTEECIYVLEGTGITETPNGSYKLSVGCLGCASMKSIELPHRNSVLKLLCFFPTDKK